MIRIATKKDIKALKQIWYEAFEKHDGKASIDYYFEHAFDLDHTFILEEDNEIKCTLQLNQHQLCFDNKVESVSFVIGVATPQKYQRQGYMRVLLDYAIDYAKNTLKQKIMILQAYNWDVYKSFGFVETYYKSKLELDFNFFADYEVVSLQEVSAAHLLSIYQNYTQSLNGYKLRDEKYFEAMIEMNAQDNFIYGVSKSAYALYALEDDKLIVNEAAFECVYDLFNLLKTLRVKHGVQSVVLNSDIYNFEYYRFEKELFMMSKILDESFTFNQDNLYISEWI